MKLRYILLKRTIAVLPVCFLLGCLFSTLAGCGASGGNVSNTANVPASTTGAMTGTGRAVLTIRWPERTTATGRLIPVAANSIVVTVYKDSGLQVARQVVPRPASGETTTTLDLPQLPLGLLKLTAAAFPNADGTGTAQASGTSDITIVADTVVPLRVVMDSTIDHIDIDPHGPITTSAFYRFPLTATARDASGAMVLLSPTKTSWTSSVPGVATVDDAGEVVPVTFGTTQITFLDSESGKSATVVFTLAFPPPPVLNPQLPMDFYGTQDGSSEIVHYDSTGKRIGSLTIPPARSGDLRGLGFGPDGFLYVVGFLTTRDFVVLKIDDQNSIQLAFTYTAPSGPISSNISYGKLAFDRNNHLLVGTSRGIVQFSLDGQRDSGTLLWSGDEVYDLAVLPSGNLLVMSGYNVREMSGTGTNARIVLDTSAGRGIAYDPATNTVFTTMLGDSFDPFALKAYDGTTYALKKTVEFGYGDDLYLANDGRLIVGSRSQSPGIFTKDLKQLGSFEGDARMFITQRLMPPLGGSGRSKALTPSARTSATGEL